jgi:hypothetical protein
MIVGLGLDWWNWRSGSDPETLRGALTAAS